MITEIKISGFKSLESVKLSLGHLNLFIGTNASGKSNFLDAIRFLQGIGYGFTIDEILNGKPKSASSEIWEQIRGGSQKIAFSGRNGTANSVDRTIEVSVTIEEKDKPTIRYSIGISASRGSVRSERLSSGLQPVYESGFVENPVEDPAFGVRYYSGEKGKPAHLHFEKSKPVLHQIITHKSFQKRQSFIIESCIRALSNTQRIDPSPFELRKYSQAQHVKRMGERGENFAALVRAIESDQKTRSAYVSWLKQLTPMELDDVSVLQGALGEPLFAIKEKGIDIPAQILSDGTLRFAAITAAFFQPDMPDVLTIEEIENGIHPSRLRLLVELLKSQAATKTQIIATTHSPVLLAWLKESDYPSTFFCKRNEETGASEIKPLSEIPKFAGLAAKQPIGELFAEGWLEGAL